MKEPTQGQPEPAPGVGSSRMVSLRARQADRRAYDYGWDAGKRGPNTVNAHFTLFASKEATAIWQQGYNDAKAKAGLAAARCCAALVEKIKDARKLSHSCWRTYVEKGFVNQRHYASGQLDAFDTVLQWINEAQHNDKAEAPED